MSSLEVLYEDQDLVVLNKPEGLIIHAGNGVEHQETLASYLEQHFLNSQESVWPKELCEENRKGIVHRLDKGTSGCIVCAKTPELHQSLSQSIKERNVHRFYWGLCRGQLKKLRSHRPRILNKLLQEGAAALRFQEDYTTLATFHKRNPKKPICFYAPESGTRKAISNYRVLSERQNTTLVEFKLQTGRTHQIRMHMSLCNFPLIGDSLYGGEKSSRMYLHAHKLEFQHPVKNKSIQVDASSESFNSFCREQEIDIEKAKHNLWPN